MASVYTNDLRLEEIGSGEQSGSWGDTTNTNLELIAEAFAFGTEAITTNANTHATTIADGATDPGRAMFLKYTGAMDSAPVITLGPNTVSKMWFIHNATTDSGSSGPYSILIAQGDGDTKVTIPNGHVKAVYSNGAGSGAIIVDAFAALSVVDLLVDDDLTVTDDMTVGGTLGVTGATTVTSLDTSAAVNLNLVTDSTSSTSGALIVDGGVGIAKKLFVGTDLDVDGTTNLDIVDIDGAVNMATTALVTGVLTTTAAAVFNGGFAANADSTMGTNKKLIFRDSDIHISSVNDGDLMIAANDEIDITSALIDINGAVDMSSTLKASGHVAFNGAALLGQSGISEAALNFDSGGNYGLEIKDVGSGTTGTFQAFYRDTAVVGTFANNSGNFLIGSSTSDKDLLFQGNDGGAAITALTLDMSEAGAATFNAGITSTGLITTTAGTSNFRAGVNAGNSIASGGNYNVAVGDEAGTALTTGDRNVAIGYSALATEDTATHNTAVGTYALATQNAGDVASYNTGIGHSAGYAITTGIQNTLIGGLAGDALTSGLNNTAVGMAALSTDTLGSRSVAIGSSALNAQNFTTATSAYNVAVGSSAGVSVTTGVENTLIGGLAGDALTTGGTNVAVGYQTLSTEDTGRQNVAVGYQALATQNKDDTNLNTAVGYQAGLAITTGVSNDIFGGSAGDALTTGSFNVAIGRSSLSADTLGSTSVAVGHAALATQNQTTAVNTYNVAVGYSAGNDITTGVENTFIGALAGDALTDADYNVAIGKGALGTNVLGSRNTAVGTNSLHIANPDTAINTLNTAVGYDAGYAVTTGTNNTLVGGNAGAAITDGIDNTVVGSEALLTNQRGTRSVAVGREALKVQNPSGAVEMFNVAVGYRSGVAVSTGVRNTLIGGLAGDTLNTAEDCVFVGYNTGNAHTTGNFNTFVGKSAGASNVDGGQNVIIGAASDTAASDGDFANGLGYDLSCVAGYTTVGKSGDDIRAAHGNENWLTVSDERYKKDIVDSTAGLSFINDLTPRTFKYKNRGELPETFRAYEADSTEVFRNSDTNHGFIAQEVKTVIDAHSEIKDGFKLWGERPDGGQELGQAALIPILVKALQELSAKNDALAARIAVLEG